MQQYTYSEFGRFYTELELDSTWKLRDRLVAAGYSPNRSVAMASPGDCGDYNFDRMDELEVGAYLKSKGVPDEHVEKLEGRRCHAVEI